MVSTANLVERGTFSACSSTSRISTRDRNEVSQYIQRTMHGYQFSPRKDSRFIDFSHNEVPLDFMSIDVIRLESDHDFVIRKGNADNLYVAQFPIDGTCEIKMGREVMTLRPGQCLMTNPSQLVHKHWRGTLLQVMLRIDSATLQRMLSEELGGEVASPLAFENVVLDGTIGRELPQFIESIFRDYCSEGLLQKKRIASQLERTLLLTLLGGAQHNFRDRFDTVALPAPFYVKRAEDYMQAHMRDDITMDDLVRAAGISERSLYYGFKRWRATTPMSHLRWIRLETARRELQTASTQGGTITRIATGLGYKHLSRFSRDYKARFGETPSQTLLNGRKAAVH